MTRKCLILAIAIAALGCAWWIPGETIVQIGLRKVALEQGVAMAMRHQSWEAAPDAEAMPIAPIVATAKRARR